MYLSLTMSSQVQIAIFEARIYEGNLNIGSQLSAIIIHYFYLNYVTMIIWSNVVLLAINSLYHFNMVHCGW